LREVSARHPEAPEARRALRSATQEMERREQATPPTAARESFPELEATFRPPATTSSPQPGTAPPLAETVMQPTLLRASPLEPTRALPAGRPQAHLWLGGGGLVVVALLGAVWLKGSTPRPAPGAPVQVAPVALPSAPASAGPAAASPSAPARRAGNRDASPQPALSPAALPGAPSPSAPPEVAGPQGRVAIASTYPVDVMWRGRALAKAQESSEVSLPVGRQTLTLVANAYLLRANVEVEVPAEGAAQVSAPALGRINVRAQPDNCQIFIDGAFIDYPPILDRPLATGPHQVTFRWPDGSSQEEPVDVGRSRPAYVTGRKP
ncbi:MAG TPA: hypothetical protein VF310_07250, partial [Vicinamibacteria bacterium]